MQYRVQTDPTRTASIPPRPWRMHVFLALKVTNTIGVDEQSVFWCAIECETGLLPGQDAASPRRSLPRAAAMTRGVATMPVERTALTVEEARLTDLWNRMVDIIGIHTVNVLMDRAIWEASQKHPELALIQYGDTGLSFEALNKSYAHKAPAEAANAFADLTSELLLILTRLLGEEVAKRLAAELQAKMPQNPRSPDKGRTS